MRKLFLPKSLTHLILGNRYNKLIKENVLPESLIVVLNLYNFEGKLSKSLKELKFLSVFNTKIIENVLPEFLIHLVFGMMFNKKNYI